MKLYPEQLCQLVFKTFLSLMCSFLSLKLPIFLVLILMGSSMEHSALYGQSYQAIPDTIIDYSKRKQTFKWVGLGAYATSATGLYFAWYDGFEQESFHFFDDRDEWLMMDKVGHSFSAYVQAELIYDLASWSGYSRKQSLNIATVSSFLGQLTIEAMDGFSSRWGFSWYDLLLNSIGTGAFYLQQKAWNAQRVKFKMSYWPESYLRNPSLGSQNTQALRANQLYGEHPLQRFIKDYNGQTIWLSFDMSAFLSEVKWPRWLNLALGYSAKNLFGGFSNQWLANGEIENWDKIYPRTSQFILAIDYDLTGIRAENEFLKGAIKFLNVFKWPAPAIQYNRLDGFSFHLMFTH